MKFLKLLFIFISVLVLVSACKTAAPTTQEATATDVPNTPTSIQTNTQMPTSTSSPTSTDTPIPTDTLVPSATFTLTEAPTATPTEFPGFENASILKAFAYDVESIFYFRVQDVDALYYGTVDDVLMTCVPDPSYEHVLICTAADNMFGKDMRTFSFFADEERKFLVFKGDFSTSLARVVPTLPPLIWPRAVFTEADIIYAPYDPTCPQRGIGLNCITEYRLYDESDCLVGHSCFDTCGWYYSVDTIKGRQGEYVFSAPCLP